MKNKLALNLTNLHLKCTNIFYIIQKRNLITLKISLSYNTKTKINVTKTTCPDTKTKTKYYKTIFLNNLPTLYINKIYLRLTIDSFNINYGCMYYSQLE